MTDEEVRNRYGFDNALQLSDNYFHKARAFSQATFDMPNVDNVQANLIMAVRDLLASLGPRAWMYAGMGIRMSQAMRLGKEYNQRHPPREKEIRRRTHWACMLIDRLISFVTARPMTMRILSVNIQLPCPEHAFVFEEDFHGPSTHEVNVYEPSSLEALATFCHAVKIWGAMTEFFVNGGRRRSTFAPIDPEGPFYQRTMQMQAWIQALPERMKWSQQNYRRHQSLGQGKLFVTMHMIMHHALVVAHQEYLPQLDAPALVSDIGSGAETQFDNVGLPLDHRDESIISVCLHNAEAISGIAAYLDTGSEVDRSMLRSAFSGSALLTAATVHLWKQYTSPDPNDPMANHSIEAARLSLNIIKSWRHAWRCAHAWTESLEMLFKLYQFAYGTNSQLSQALAQHEMDTTDTDTTADSTQISEISKQLNDDSYVRDGSGYMDPSKVCQRLYDKIRNTMISPLESSATKKRHMRVYLSTLWQHMWTQDVINGITFDGAFTSPFSATTGAFETSQVNGDGPTERVAGVWSNIDQGGLFEF